MKGIKSRDTTLSACSVTDQRHGVS